MKKALQAIKNRAGMSAERAHREDAEKEEESRERKLVALEQIAAASLRGAVAAERTAADVHLLRRGFDLFEGNALEIRRTVEAWYQMVDEEKRQAKAQGAGSDIEDPAEEEGNESNEGERESPAPIMEINNEPEGSGVNAGDESESTESQEDESDDKDDSGDSRVFITEEELQRRSEALIQYVAGEKA